MKTLNFDQLDEQVQQGVLEQQRIFLSEVWDADYLIQEFSEDMKKFGLENVKVMYSGFGSQGDGASFTADIDFLKWIKVTGRYKEYRRLYTCLTRHPDYYESQASINQSGHYCHRFTMSAEIELFYYGDSDWSWLSDAENKLEKDLTEWARDKAHELYGKLESDYFSQTSDESVKESIEINEYRYYPCGCIA